MSHYWFTGYASGYGDLSTLVKWDEIQCDTMVVCTIIICRVNKWTYTYFYTIILYIDTFDIFL